MSEQPVNLVAEDRKIGEVHQPDRPPPDLVFISGSDAASRGTDSGAGIGGLAEDIEFLMQGQYQSHVFGNAQRVRSDLHALTLEPRYFLDQGGGIEHDPIPDDR